ncbi:MAG TPA: APC family permease [Terriglobia bacterium]|nr:APC family permease [Terriglobia bacterium]
MAKQKPAGKRAPVPASPPGTVVVTGDDQGWAASLANLLFGKPLATSEERAERIGSSAGIPIFGLDALSSAAYGPEAALTLLIPLGAAGIAYILPISVSIIILLAIVYFSYRQTIAAYPTGGGSYTVARENLGPYAGLLAGTALMIDYILTAAVGISAGVGALVSAVPSLQPHTLGLCLVILLALTIVNLRGVREVGAVFMIPTYLFIVTLLGTLALGLVKTLAARGHPMPVVSPPHVSASTAALSAWLLVQAFSSGCTAMTGVEAVSNGVKAFREPVVKSAQRTLTAIIALLALMLAGIAYLVRSYHIAATNPGETGYQSVLSLLVAAVAGKNVFYYVTMGSILLVLALSANTAFADFPRLCRAMAEDSYLPSGFAERGRRLVYSQGIGVLAVFCGLLLMLFGGVTDRLIPLYAVGAFLAFTLSQAGMVMHWKRTRGPGWRHSMFVNGLGAVTTAVTVLVVAVAKFAEGAWVTVLLIPAAIVLMLAIRRHYNHILAMTADPAPLDLKGLHAPLVVVPILRWSKISKKALRFALTVSSEVRALHIASEEDVDDLRKQWATLVEAPTKKAGQPPPSLVLLKSPYRFVLGPIVEYVLNLERENPGRIVAVLIPELVETRWHNYLIHNQRAQWLKALLLIKGNRRIVVINVPWYLDREEPLASG